MPKVLSAELILTVMLAIITPIKIAAGAESPYPRINISADLDVNAGIMRAGAVIDLPATSPGEIFFPGLEIEKITVNGREIDISKSGPVFFKNDHALNLRASDAARTIKITYRYRPAVDELLGPGQIYLHRSWHPYLAVPAIFSLEATLPKGFHAISQAEKIVENVNGDKVTASFFFPHPRRGLDLIAGPYEISRKELTNGPDLYAFFFPEDHDLVADYLEKAASYIKRYQGLIGPFPYKRFSIVENRLPTGFAMPTFTLLGQQVARLPFITRTSLGHEILHQWFGNSVSVANESGNWCEGLTTCLADQSYAADQGRGAGFRKNQLLRYESFVNKTNAISLEQFLGAKSHLIPGQDAARAVGYTKASMVFHMLRKKIGDEAFFKGLRLFFKRFNHRPAQWSDIEAAFSENTTEKLDTFFTGWLTGRDIPRLSLTGLRVREKGGKINLSFDLRQTANKPLVMTVPCRIITPSGVIDRRVKLNDRLFHVSLDLDDYPEKVIIDPRYDLMRHLDPSELTPVWSRVMGTGKKIFVLKDKKSEKKYAALLRRFRHPADLTLLGKDADDRRLENADLVFIDADGKKAQAMFADNSGASTHGFSLEVRRNPLNPGRTATLVRAASAAEVQAAARKLSHYGKYSYLAFDNGGIKEKKVTATAMGLIYSADPEPDGVEIRPRLGLTEIMTRIADRRVVYVGESHTSPADHHLEIRVVRAMYRQNQNLAIGMEMFSHEAQSALDRYILKKETNEKEFLRQCDYFKRWGYDFRFYRPILDFARANAIPVIALNQPKPIVSRIYSKGIDALSPAEVKDLPPERDLTLPDYRERLNRIFRMHRGKNRLNDFLQAQAVWDETMAATAATWINKHPGGRMVILAGRGHVEKNAIPPRLARRTGIPQTVLLNNDPSGRAGKIADFVLFTRAAPLPRLPIMGVMLRESKKGVLIAGVGKDSPAAKAGVKKNDIILTADNEKIKTINDIKVLMLYKKKGGNIRLRLERKHLLWPTTTGVVEVKL